MNDETLAALRAELGEQAYFQWLRLEWDEIARRAGGVAVNLGTKDEPLWYFNPDRPPDAPARASNMPGPDTPEVADVESASEPAPALLDRAREMLRAGAKRLPPEMHRRLGYLEICLLEREFNLKLQPTQHEWAERNNLRRASRLPEKW